MSVFMSNGARRSGYAHTEEWVCNPASQKLTKIALQTSM
jgi:hypothetical protein